MRTRVESTLNTIWLLLVRITLALVVIYLLWMIRSVLITVILAVMLAYVLNPVVDVLCRRRYLRIARRWHRLIATILVFVIFFLIVGITINLLYAPFEREALKFKDTVDQYTEKLKQTFGRAQDWYVKHLPADWRAFIEKQDFRGLGAGIGRFATRVIQGTLEWLSHIIEILLIPVLAFYFVLDSRALKREFLAIVPRRRIREALWVTRHVGSILQSYVIGQIILCLIAGLVTWIVLHLVGMRYALILALFAGVTRAIPIIGPIVSGIPICILGALQSMALGLWLLVFVVVMHFAESKFVLPILIGDRLRLHPAVILIVLLIGAELFGVLGMFLAAPIAAIIRELVYFYIIRPRRMVTKEMVEWSDGQMVTR